VVSRSIDNINYEALNLAIYSSLLFFLPLKSTLLSHFPAEGVFFVTSEYRYILGAFAKLRNATVSFVTSVRLSTWDNSAPNGRIFMKFGFSLFFEKLSGKIQDS